jgi:hypothetical protein
LRSDLPSPSVNVILSIKVSLRLGGEACLEDMKGFLEANDVREKNSEFNICFGSE